MGFLLSVYKMLVTREPGHQHRFREAFIHRLVVSWYGNYVPQTVSNDVHLDSEQYGWPMNDIRRNHRCYCSVATGLVVILSLLASGCLAPAQRDEFSPYYLPPEQSLLRLHRAIEIPAGYARVHFQDGQYSAYGYNEYLPHCELEVNDVLETAQTVKADEFVINRVQYEDYPFAHRMPLRLAGVGVGIGFGHAADPDMKLVRLGLYSVSQPNVRALICGGGLDDPYLAEPPSIRDIRAALGDTATLILPTN